MFLYNIGYGSYEESEFTQMTFDKELSQEDLHKYVINAILTVLNNVINKKYNRFRISEFGVSYQDIHDYVIEELEKVGFQQVKFTAEWSCFGWPSLTDDKDWEGQRNETLDRISKEIPDNIKNAINQRSELERNFNIL